MRPHSLDRLFAARAVAVFGTGRNLQAVDLPALRRVVHRVSEMVCESPRQREHYNDPQLAKESGAQDVDTDIVVGLDESARDR